MATKQKPLSFSLHPLNHAYIESVVSKQKEANHRYNRSMYMDDLITHLRTKAEAKPKTELVVVKKKKAPTKKFIKPTVGEVAEYCLCRGNNIDAETFVAHYETNGWVQGKNKPVKNWRSCIITWEKSNKVPVNKAEEHDDTLNDTSWANNLDDVL